MIRGNALHAQYRSKFFQILPLFDLILIFLFVCLFGSHSVTLANVDILLYTRLARSLCPEYYDDTLVPPHPAESNLFFSNFF